MWNKDLPDSELTVLVRLNCDESPICLGFHDGDGWRYLDDGEIDVEVIGWMDAEDAAKILDKAMPEVTA